jgi:hypothetical protein
MKEYLIKLCHGDFIYAKYVYKSCFVKIEMSEDEKKDFHERCNQGEEMYVVFAGRNERIRFKIKKHIPFLTNSYKSHVVVELIKE